MHEETLEVIGADGLPLKTFVWTPENVEVRGVVQIVHGQAERANRYARFAKALTDQGYAAFSHDLRGHGETCQLDKPGTEWGIMGHFADEDGWNKCVNDGLLVQAEMAKRFAGKNVVLFGHSLGSMIAQNMMIFNPRPYSGLCLSGCLLGVTARTYALRLIIWGQHLFLGGRAPGQWIHMLTFDSFLEPFQPIKTPADWLSRDVEECEKFVADPLLGATSSAQHWLDFANGFEYISRVQNLKLIGTDMPVAVFGGTMDAAADMGAGFQRLVKAYQQAGFKDFEQTVYEGARHELLNETNRDEVTADMLDWINRKMPG